MFKKISTRILTGLLVLFFTVAGIEKLRESFHIVANYEAIGLSIAFMKIIGIFELIGAAGLLFQRTARSAALWLTLLSTFTLVTSVSAQLWDAVIVAVIALVLTFTLAQLKRTA